jgi:hypothetical protein
MHEKRHISKKISLIFFLLISCFPGLLKAEQNKMTLDYIEYNRGMSFPTKAQIRILYPGRYDLTFHSVDMTDKSFYPDNSIVPNAFFAPLLKGNLKDALFAFTEPYYGIKFTHFFKSRPNWGIGIEFIHLKVFLPEKEQIVHITGTEGTEEVNRSESIHNYIRSFNVSHGVNHISLSVVYRLMLLTSEKIPAGKIQPYTSVSFGPCIPHPQLRLNGEDSYKAFSHQFSFGNLGLGLNLGARFQLFKCFGFYIEYKFTYSLLNDMHFDDDPTSKIRTSFPNSHLAWGISCGF